MPDPSDPGFTTAFDVIFGLVATVVVLGLVAAVATTIYRAVRLRRQGLNPLTIETDLAARALRSDALREHRSKAERLAELNVLAANGTISAGERESARARILAE